MRKFLPIAIIIVVVSVIIFIINKTPTGTAANPTSLAPITVSVPENGAVKGKTYTIRWIPGKGTTNIFLVDRALESEGVSISLADRVYNVENNGKYSYTFPIRIPSGEYKFQIGEYQSDYFTVK